MGAPKPIALNSATDDARPSATSSVADKPGKPLAGTGYLPGAIRAMR
jgi:hypothetical protein